MSTAAGASGRLVVPARFNGPPTSGNGGYVAGLLAARLEGGVAAVEVTLREPPPLDTPLTVSVDDDGVVAASFGGAVVATAKAAELQTDPLPPVGADEAAAAESRYGGLTAHPYPTCFVCGVARPAGDGMGLRPGRVAPGGNGDGPVATTWTPRADLVSGERVDPVFVWAALDCPGGWATDIVGRPSLLGRMTAAVHACPEPGERCVVVGRVLGGEGRKTFTASTAYDPDGRVLGHAEATWIALRPSTS